MKIFITGATGFIGSNLCRHFLKKGYTINIGVRENANLLGINDIKNKLRIFTYTDSISDLATFFIKAEVQAVFHLASCFIAEHKTEEAQKLILSNIFFGTLLLEAMKVAGIKDLINTGTSWQHFNNQTYNPVCLYAATKEAFEKIIKYYTEAEGFSCITIKLFDSYGENDTRPKLINMLSKFASDGKVLNMSKGEQEINLLHVDDICYGYEKALEFLKIKGALTPSFQYTLSAREKITLRELIGLFNSISPQDIKINWGSKDYRKREVMELWTDFEILPNWEQRISLEDGLKRIFKQC